MRKKSAPKSANIFSGVPFDASWPDHVCALALFRFAPKWEKNPNYWPFPFDPPEGIEPCYCGTGRFEHAQDFARMVHTNTFEWHKWSDRGIQNYCEHEQTAESGCTTSGKSTTAALYAEEFYLCAPHITAVLIASTTIDGAKRRIWKPLSAYYSEYVRKTNDRNHKMIGSPLPSICPLVDGKRDEAHGIHVVAVGGGELEKGIAKLKGFHPRRLLLIGDEADSISEAVIEVRANLRSVEEEFQCIWLGNDPSLLCPLGKLMEPEPNLPIGLQHTEWISTTGIKCSRFDAMDSPNITEKPRNKYTGLITKETVDAIIRDAGGENTPMVYIMVHGIHPPEGVDNTVCSEAMITRFNCRDKVVWKASFTSFASLDPGFGGDQCTFRTFKRGLDKDGDFQIECDETIYFPIKVNEPENPVEYQIAEKVVELCEARAIPPDEFIIGSTGIGRGCASVLQREWSPRILECDEGGTCSTMIVSEEDPRPAKDLYDRKVTELWFSIREFCEAYTLKGLDNITCRQLCSRKFEIKGTGQGKRRAIEKKEEMIKSPNDADALAFAIDLCRKKGIFPVVQTEVKTEMREEEKRASEEYDFDSSEKAYSDPLEDALYELDY